MKYQEAIILEAPIPIACIDLEMNFIGANSHFLAALGLASSTALKGKSLSTYFESLDILSSVDNFINSKDIILEFYQSFLTERKMKYFKFILRKISSQKAMIAIYAEDQSAINEKNQELEALRSASITNSRMAILGEMASGIAHEINNPLALIVGLTTQLQRMSASPNQNNIEEMSKKFEKIKNTTLRIDKIVRGLKSYARDSSNDPFQSNLVVNLINDSLELCSDKLRHHEINLIVDDIDPAIQLDCRGSQISQVILNLISNAKDAIKNQENEEKWIKVGAKDAGDSIEFTLTDSGKGIDPDISAKILNPFFTTKAVGEGTGLGLTISKRIIESHFGKLAIAQNTSNTTFIFSIPKGLSLIA